MKQTRTYIRADYTDGDIGKHAHADILDWALGFCAQLKWNGEDMEQFHRNNVLLVTVEKETETEVVVTSSFEPREGTIVPEAKIL